MPVKKPATKPTAKKAVAKKTSSATAKKSSPAKKNASGSSQTDIIDVVIAALNGGEFDGRLDDLDDALTNRINTIIKAETAEEKKKSSAAATKKVSAPPAKSKSAIPTTAKVTPKKDGVYLHTKLGAKVKFLRHKVTDGAQDKNKSVVEMIDGVEGKPRGTKVVVATNLLDNVPAAKKTAAKKSAPATKKKATAKK